jgi:hypothetical protein
LGVEKTAFWGAKMSAAVMLDERRFIAVDNEWVEQNQRAGSEGYASFPIMRGRKQIGNAFMGKVHWQILVSRDTRRTQQHILFALGFVWAGQKDDGYMKAWPSISLISQQTGFGKRTIERTLPEAAKQGWLMILKQKPTQSGHVRNLYVLSVPEKALEVCLDDPSPIVKLTKIKKPKPRSKQSASNTTNRQSDGAHPQSCRSDTATEAVIQRQDGGLIHEGTHEANKTKETILVANATAQVKNKLEKGNVSVTPQESPPSVEGLQEDGKKLIQFAEVSEIPLDDFTRLSEISQWNADECRERIQAVREAS